MTSHGSTMAAKIGTPMANRRRRTSAGRLSASAQAAATRTGSTSATGPLTIVPAPQAAKKTTAARRAPREEGSRSIASNAAIAAAVIARVSIMSKITILAKTIVIGVSARANAAMKPASRPSRRRANQKTRTTHPNADSADGIRAPRSSIPKRRIEAATAQKKAGGLSR